MKIKKKGLIILLACVVMICGAITVKATLDLSQKCSITFLVGLDNTAYNGDLTLDKVNIKLYQIASATANERDSYDLNINSEYSSLVTSEQLTSSKSSDLIEIAEQLAQASESLPAIEYQSGSKTLDAGCYLAVIDDVTTEGYVYRFEPMLISLPQGLEADSTAGGMYFDVQVTLKASQEYRKTDVLLNKTFESYNASLGETTVVFNVVITYPDLLSGENVVESRIVGLSFDSSNLTQSYVIKDVPVGAQIVATEVYTGASYSTNVTELTYTVLSPDSLPEGSTQGLGFVNFYDKKLISGHGIVNHFEYDGSKWNWSKSKSSY